MESKAQILYVDDEPNNLFAFKSVFRRTYSVLTASGGAEALSLIKDNKIDLVLSDHRMPEMTGVELCKYIMNQFPTLKRMIVTGYQDEESIVVNDNTTINRIVDATSPPLVSALLLLMPRWAYNVEQYYVT